MVVLLEGSPISTEIALGHLPDQCPSHPIAQFGQVASSRKSVRGSNLLPFKNEETFNAAEMFWYTSPGLCLDTILSWSSTDTSFDLMAWFLL